MSLLMLGNIDDEWCSLRNETPDSHKIDRLCAIYKHFDLRTLQDKQITRDIAAWIASENEELRAAVVSALCIYRPVAGYGNVLLEGWRRASNVTIHIIASGIEAYIQQLAAVPIGLVPAIIARLGENDPSVADPLDFAQLEKVNIQRIIRASSWRALVHIGSLVFPDCDKINELRISEIQLSKEEISWYQVSAIIAGYLEWRETSESPICNLC